MTGLKGFSKSLVPDTPPASAAGSIPKHRPVLTPISQEDIDIPQSEKNSPVGPPTVNKPPADSHIQAALAESGKKRKEVSQPPPKNGTMAGVKTSLKAAIALTLATIVGICHDRFIIVDQEEIFWTGASLKDAGRLTFAAAKMYPPSEASCEAGSMRGARRSSPGFSNQSARRHLHDGNTARARRRKHCDNCDASKGEGFGIICT